MPVAKLIAPTTKQEIPKLRVAAYCRVSSNSADQRNSFATQERVYTKYIAEKQEWELVDIFADEGLSGMKADNRPEFQRMIRMCKLHQIDLILTKSVSRFARNVKEALNYTRKLKLLGIGVQFEEDGINTLTMADEMLLNTFAAIAQEESKSISQNQRLSIVKRMESGEYIASNAPYGYRLIDKKLVIYEPEAEVVRWIFAAYLNGMSTVEIAHELSAKSVLTKGKKEQWKANRIAYILSNEKYDGDTLFQKYYGEETVPFKKTSQLWRDGSVFCVQYPRCNFTTGNVSGCTNTTSEQRQEVWKENVSIRIPSYKPHSVFRVRRFLSSEGAERNGQMGLLQTRSRHNRLQFRLLQ